MKLLLIGQDRYRPFGGYMGPPPGAAAPGAAYRGPPPGAAPPGAAYRGPPPGAAAPRFKQAR